MSHHYLKKVVSVAVCIILSIPLTLVVERLTKMQAPGGIWPPYYFPQVLI